MREPTARQVSILREFLRLADDCVMASSDWTTGSGNYITRRTIPVGCNVISVEQVDRYSLSGDLLESIRQFIADRPRVKKLIVCTDPDLTTNGE
jgi:trehalose-6-phosphate synthase